MTQARITQLCNVERSNLLVRVAREFAKASGQAEPGVLHVLHQQERDCLLYLYGHSRFENAREQSCRLLVVGWENVGCVLTPAEAMARLEHATAYGILARRDHDKYSKWGKVKGD